MVIIPSQAYGQRTSSLQEVIRRAELISPLSEPAELAEGELMDHIEGHVARLSSGQARVPRVGKLEILRGLPSVLGTSWESCGEEWRSLLGETIGEMHRRYSGRPYLDRLTPPIWPVRGLINVFGPTFVATEQARKKCEALGTTRWEVDACWLAVCFVEKLIDAALVAELFGDLEPNNPFAPLLAICATGAIPIGITDDRFYLYAYERGDTRSE